MKNWQHKPKDWSWKPAPDEKTALTAEELKIARKRKRRFKRNQRRERQIQEVEKALDREALLELSRFI